MNKKYQTLFELNLMDLDLVEHALREQARTLSLALVQNTPPLATSSDNEDGQDRLQQINALLGKLHHQKEWFTPEHYVPRGWPNVHYALHSQYLRGYRCSTPTNSD